MRPLESAGRCASHLEGGRVCAAMLRSLLASPSKLEVYLRNAECILGGKHDTVAHDRSLHTVERVIRFQQIRHLRHICRSLSVCRSPR